jgi:hypothetical protein
MIEKLMLENNFYCGRNADLSNSVFLFPWKPWTLHYKRLLFICYRQVSIEQIKKSINHLAPCSQEIIDNENPILIRFFFGRCEMRLFGCHGNNNCFSFHGNHGHYLNFHCYQFKIWHLVMKSVIWKSLWPKQNFMILAWYEMHLKCFIFVSIATIHII